VPQVVWSRFLEGERPGLLLGEDRILLHYKAAGGKGAAIESRCYDFEGRQLWSRPGWIGMLTLPRNGFLVNTSEGRLFVVNGGGEIMHRWPSAGVERAVLHGQMLLLADKQRVWAADLELRCLWQFTWPASSGPAIDCFAAGAFYWVGENALWHCTPDRRAEVLCELPSGLISSTMDAWEQGTGNSALSGWYIRPGMSDFAPFQVGDRPDAFYWRVGFDEDGQQCFLANAMAPHLILCLDLSGHPLWCKYLSCGCCGGIPSRLPNGLYVASSGCGGILSWLDGDGNILFRSEPHEGVGLATAYSNEVQVLPDGRCLVEGGPGVVAYGPTGERLWVFGREYSRSCCDPAGQILVGCYWENNEAKAPNRTCLELAHGL
jgi:hypothetical protein